MRYSFDFSSNGNLADGANWQPSGGPPGAGDTALFLSTSFFDATLYGSLSTGAFEFIGYDTAIFLNGDTLQATMPLGLQNWHDNVELSNSSLTTTLLNDSDGGTLSFADSSVQSERMVVHKPVQLSQSLVSVFDTTWTNTGDVVVAYDVSGPTLDGGSILSIEEDSTVKIGGNLIAYSVNATDAPKAAVVSIGDGSTMDVGGNVRLGPGGVLDVQGSVLTVTHDLRVDEAGTGQAVVLVEGPYGVDATLDVGNDAIVGAGSTLTVTSGTLSVGNELSVLGGGQLMTPDGTIEANTISLRSMAFLGATAQYAYQAGPGAVTGLNGGDTAITNQGTIDATGMISVAGSISGAGTVLVGDSATATGDLNVTGTLSGQNVQFGGAGSELLAGSFASDVINGFAAGDIIASPGIQSIAYDASSGTLSMDKGGGNVQSVHMTGDFTGQQFVLSQNEYITLQPAT